MKILALILFTSVLWAQAPTGSARLRYGNANSRHFNRTGLDANGAGWDMGSASGGIVAPAFGSAGTFALTGTTPLACATPSGGTATCALDFNGSSDFLEIADSPSVSATSTMSFMVAFRTDVVKTFGGMIKDAGGGNAQGLLCGNWTTCGCLITQSNNTQVASYDPDAYPVGAWVVYHCVADGSNIRTYRNGVLKTTTAYDGTILDDPNPLVLGAYGVNYLDGAIAYSSARRYPLTQAEAQQSYKALRNQLCSTYPATGAGTFCTDLPQ